MYKSRRTIFVFLLALVLILGVLPEFHVRAEDNSQTYKVGADDHTLWDRVQDGVFQYAAGSMEIEGAGLQGDAAQADVEAGTEITITLTPGKDCALRSFMVNGQSIAVASMTTNGASYIYKTKVENANLKFEPSFEASGGNAPGPNPGTGNNICFRLEGDGISSNDYATWKNNNIEIYIGIENTYKTLQEWIGENTISVNGAEYRVDDSVDTVKVYVLNSGSGKYMIQGAGSSQENAVTWTECLPRAWHSPDHSNKWYCTEYQRSLWKQCWRQQRRKSCGTAWGYGYRGIEAVLRIPIEGSFTKWDKSFSGKGCFYVYFYDAKYPDPF